MLKSTIVLLLLSLFYSQSTDELEEAKIVYCDVITEYNSGEFGLTKNSNIKGLSEKELEDEKIMLVVRTMENLGETIYDGKLELISEPSVDFLLELVEGEKNPDTELMFYTYQGEVEIILDEETNSQDIIITDSDEDYTVTIMKLS